jgi:phosphomevalonate kinase
MLAGEYAVLDGCAAVVMAVDRFATATASRDALDDSLGWNTPEAQAAVDEAFRSGYLKTIYHTRVRPGTLFDGAQTRKLGLGSSAAMCVAALGAAKLAEHWALNSAAPLDALALARVARIGHRKAQGGGSGVDVIASALGGINAITIDKNGEDFYSSNLTWPDGIHWRIFWTGEPVSTKQFVARVRALAANDPAQYARVMTPLAESATQFVHAMRSNNALMLVDAVAQHGEWMDALGQAAMIPIVTPSMRALALRAKQLGCAIKPSGAGGGDIVLAISQSALALDALAAELPENIVCIDMELSTEGITPLKSYPERPSSL